MTTQNQRLVAARQRELQLQEALHWALSVPRTENQERRIAYIRSELSRLSKMLRG